MKSMGQEFFFGLTSEGGNLWFSPANYIVASINQQLGEDGAATGNLGYDWISVKDSQGKIDVDNGSFFGFKARDLFNHFGFGLTFGYQPMFSPFGTFVRAGYKYRQFRTQIDRELDYQNKYKLNSWSAGVGIRITPLVGLLEDYHWSPILEVGTDYNKPFSVKAPYDNDCSQFGSGFSTHFALGARITDGDEGMSISVSFEMPHYDYFNRDYTLSSGEKPYSDVKSKNYSISLNFQRDF